MRPAVSPYIYDANGNRTGGNNGGAAISASYDGQDRLSSYNVTYKFNANGELLTATSPQNQQTLFAYDTFGQLKRVTLPAGEVVRYLTDGQNRRIARRSK